uniref:Uncharacterized protein n=1 Tax=Lactuca sativa TaxID=4236 RepID=A0A9R1VF65_LACSA|nr:hypothetical protein LSAT_V11C500250890 [Lactuca sativa]
MLIYVPFNLRAFSSGTAVVDDLFGKNLHSLSFFEPFGICIAPNYRSDPTDEKENFALLLSLQTYPPRNSWKFCRLLLSLLTSRHHMGRSEQQLTPIRRFSSWVAVSRSRGHFAHCPRIWVICSLTMLLQSNLAGERYQFATKNKTTSKHTFFASSPPSTEI